VAAGQGFHLSVEMRLHAAITPRVIRLPASSRWLCSSQIAIDGPALMGCSLIKLPLIWRGVSSAEPWLSTGRFTGEVPQRAPWPGANGVGLGDQRLKHLQPAKKPLGAHSHQSGPTIGVTGVLLVRGSRRRAWA